MSCTFASDFYSSSSRAVSGPSLPKSIFITIFFSCIRLGWVIQCVGSSCRPMYASELPLALTQIDKPVIHTVYWNTISTRPVGFDRSFVCFSLQLERRTISLSYKYTNAHKETTGKWIILLLTETHLSTAVRDRAIQWNSPHCTNILLWKNIWGVVTVFISKKLFQ